MILHRDGAPRHDEPGGAPQSVPEIGRALRQARARQGLSIAQVSHLARVEPAQIEALESGTVARLPDRVATLQALRHTAEALDLPADRFVVAMLDLWPASTDRAPDGATVYAAGAAPENGAGSTGLPDDAALLATVGGEVPPTLAVTGVVAASAVTADDPRPTAAHPPPLHSTDDVSGPPTGMHTSTAPVPLLVADTGSTPAVKSKRRRDGEHPSIGMALLRATVVVVAALVVVSAAGLVVNHYRPQWLRTLHLPHSTPPTTVPVPPQPAGPVFAVTSTNSTGATMSIRASLFMVSVSAGGGESWLEANDADHLVPIYAGILQEGQTQSFTVENALTVQVGSTAGRVVVQVNGKTVGFYFQPAAPYTMTFRAVS